jgi:hypothetical protein
LRSSRPFASLSILKLFYSAVDLIDDSSFKFDTFEKLQKRVQRRMLFAAFLDDAARLWETEMCVVIKGYEAKRSSGKISSAISDEQIVGAAMQQAYFAQAQCIVNGNLNPRQVKDFGQLTRDAQHPKGSTWTEKYGNLSLSRDQSSSHAAEQRS